MKLLSMKTSILASISIVFVGLALLFTNATPAPTAAGLLPGVIDGYFNTSQNDTYRAIDQTVRTLLGSGGYLFYPYLGPSSSAQSAQFVSESKGFILSWPRDSNQVSLYHHGQNVKITDAPYAYSQALTGNLAELVSCATLLNSSNAKMIPSQGLGHAILVDGYGTGQPLLFVQDDGDGYYYVYRLPSYVANSSSATCVQNLKPVTEGVLYNTPSGTPVPVTGNDLPYLFAVDYEGTGVESIQGIQSGANWNYIWSFTGSVSQPKLENYYVWQNFPGLNPLPVSLSEVLGFFPNRVSSGTSNLPGGTELYFTTKTGEYRLQYSAAAHAFSYTALQNCQANASLCQNKLVLLSLDESMSNGPLENMGPNYGLKYDLTLLFNNLVATKSLLAAKGIKFAVLVDPAHKNRQAVYDFLDRLAENKIQFVLDALTSTSVKLNVGQTAEDLGAQDWSYFPSANDPALTMTLNGDLPYLEGRYGTTLMGYRVMEQDGLTTSSYPLYSGSALGDFEYSVSNGSCQSSGKSSTPGGAYFYDTPSAPGVRSDIQTLLHHVSQPGNNRRVFWFDNMSFNQYQYSDVNPVSLQQILNAFNDYRAFKSCLSQLYPNQVLPVYDNNEPFLIPATGGVEQLVTPSNFRLDAWQNSPNYYLTNSGQPTDRDFGLSNQSWRVNDPFFNQMDFPSEQVYAWTVSLLNATNGLGHHTANLLELEPLFYFFSYPAGESATSPSEFTTKFFTSTTCPLGAVNAPFLAQLRALDVTDTSTLTICH